MNNQLISGHSLCLGCNAGIIGNEIMQTIDEPVVIVLATGCLEVGTTTYPNSSWPVPTIHVAFGSAPVVASGIYRAKNILIQKLKKDPKLKKLYPEVDQKIKIIVIAGDGATYDIGLGALSAMAERGEDILYICYNNQAYMNTGIQKSGATPIGAENTTQPDWQNSQKLYPKSIVNLM